MSAHPIGLGDLFGEPPSPPATVNTLQQDFREWYRVFPRKKKPADAERAYRQARKLATAAELLAGAERYAAERQGKDPEFTSYPGTWLRARRWQDEPDAPPVSAPKPELSPEFLERLRRAAGYYPPPVPSPEQVAKEEAEKQERLESARAFRARIEADAQAIEAGRRDFADWCERRRAAGLSDSYRQYLTEDEGRAR